MKKCTCSKAAVNPAVKELCKEWVLSESQLKDIMAKFLDDLKKGLGKATHPTSIVKCFVTYVQDLPNGTEKGKFLALDLGGTNFRVLLITLDNQKFQMESKIFAIADNIMTGSGEELFDYIADCLDTFSKEQGVSSEVLPLGFTFSFPLKQVGLTKGLLETWTKGFNCSGVVGEDVVNLLTKSLKKKNLQISVMAILNDTTGTMMSCAWKNRNTFIGLIVGTGSNACYVEKLENAETYDGPRDKPNIVINTEWGAFGNDGKLDFIITKYDKEADAASINPGKQIFEKMISGMYMGELVRLLLMKLANDGTIFKGKNLEQMSVREKFLTKFVSFIEEDPPNDYTKCREVLTEMGVTSVCDLDCINVRYVCECVSTRSSDLVSAGIATLINKMGRSEVTVGIDGSVYRFHPHFHDRMTERIGQLIKPGITFQLMLSEDGSGRGAALVAAVADRTGAGSPKPKSCVCGPKK